MNLFSNSSNQPNPRKPKRSGRPKARLELEALEDRSLPSATCPAISGFVYHDANNNGLYDPTLGETPIANSQIELRDSTGALVETTTTDSQGFYEFEDDPRISQAVTTLTRTAIIPLTQTNFDISKAVGQFDPELGQLQKIEIVNTTSLTSDIKAENASTISASTISGNVEGKFTLTMPGGQTLATNPRGNAGSFTASIYDGILDYAGTSGRALPSSSASDSKTLTLTGSAMDVFKGTGTVNLRQVAVGASSVSDTNGNADSSIRNRGSATINVIYYYIPGNCLEPGTYKLIQTNQPPGFVDGKESRAGSVIPNSVGTDTISVTLGNVDATHNDFGEVKLSSLAGYVYLDTGTGSYNDGIKAPGEQSIPNTLVTLTGTNDLGQAINTALSTDGNGFYKFSNLRPGTYTLTETQPGTYQDGKDTVGTPGGNTTNDKFANINLPSNYNGVNNNFGELPPVSSLSGFVYLDTNKTGGLNDGIKQSDEAGIASVTVTLSGTTDQGPVNLTTTTNGAGFYQFLNLRPGTYTVTETQPTQFVDGKDTIGSLSGNTTNDQHFNINVPGGANGVNYNFGELPPPASLSGYVYVDANQSGGLNDGIKQPDEPGIANVTVTLTGTGDQGPVSMTTTTNGAGFYQFLNLRPGTYVITETQPTQYVDGKDTIGSLSGSTINDQHYNINLTGGASGINYNFGELPPTPLSSLSGYVYIDTKSGGYNDGIKQPDEIGIGGVLVTLTGNSDEGPVNKTTTTNAGGFYQFTSLRPGVYIVTESQPAGYIDGKDTIGSLGGNSVNDQHYNITTPPGSNGVNFNFGELIPVTVASLSGYVYADTNKVGGLNDGVKQPDEAGIPNVVIALTGSNDQGAVNLTTTTNAVGFYQFANLRPGFYIVTETAQPAGYVDGKDTIGSVGGQTVNEQHYNINLQGGANGINYNFGEVEFVKKTERPPIDPPYPHIYTYGGLRMPPQLYIPSKLDLTNSALAAQERRNTNFVGTIYQSLLNRKVDAASLSYWVTALRQGKASRGDVAAAVYNSLEHRQLQVEAYFQAILGRTSTAADRGYWGGMLASGWNELEFGAMLLGSNEFANAHPPGEAGFVAGLYEKMLGRFNLDPNETTYWIGRTVALNNRYQVAREFMNMPEVLSKLVEIIYADYLRPAAPGETAYWTGMILAGRVAPAGVVFQVLGSNEFYLTKVPMNY